jgi:hypothetical protein
MTTLHRPRKSRFSFLALALILPLAVAPPLLAEDDDDDGLSRTNGSPCAVKFVCGDTDTENRAVGGVYRTAINILNISGKTVNYSKSIALTTPPDDEVPETPGEVLPLAGPIAGSLASPAAFDVDCNEIFTEFGASGPFAEGFLILSSNGPLQVTAVYTAGGDSEEGVESIDVEEVKCSGGSSGGDDDDD